jgi:glutamine synthetase
MVCEVNPLEKPSGIDFTQKQTVEFRCSDGSADIYLLLAGITTAALHGFEMENALDFAKKTYVDVNIHKAENKDKVKGLAQLPASCAESAEMLSKQRHIYEKHGIFNAGIIDDMIAKLKSFNDANIRKEIEGKPERMLEIVNQYFHVG